jgi:hypothetical protein
VLGPFWVWLLTGETPGLRTLAGGALVLGALLGICCGSWPARGPRRCGRSAAGLRAIGWDRPVVKKSRQKI